jgi:hypothetical protein
MAAINFPDSPALNEEFQSGNTTWKWNGTVWLKMADSVTADSLLRLSGSTIYPYDFGTENFSTTQSILIGSGSGYGTTYAKNSIFLGTEAGYSASFFDKNNEFPEDTEGFVGYMYAIGYQAGSGSDNSDNTVMIGTKAGANTNQSYQSVLIGTEAGAYSGSKRYSVTIGPGAGVNTSLEDSIAIGVFAGSAPDTGNGEEGWLEEFGTDPILIETSVLIGGYAGYLSYNSVALTAIGNNAGVYAYNSERSTFIGRSAGVFANNSPNSVFIGADAGDDANNSPNSTFIGTSAGFASYSSSFSTYIGYGAGAYIQDSEIIKPSTVNNIVIGTLIGLPYDSSNAINIGGLIFGTGSFSEYSEEIYSGSANGRIGINQPTPQKELDISGSVRISQLSTSLTAPVTSGSTKMVITDSNGDLSFTDISGGGDGLLRLSGSTIYPYNFGTENFSTNNSILIGSGSGNNSEGAGYSTFIGPEAGYSAYDSSNSVFIGDVAGRDAYNSQVSIFIGSVAGLEAHDAYGAIYVGLYAGRAASNTFFPIYIGSEAGYEASSNNSIFIGQNSGYKSSNSDESIFIGREAGSTQELGLNPSPLSIFLGSYAGFRANGATGSIFIGNGTGKDNQGTNNIVIGNKLGLPYGYNNGINIGGILFGSGSYTDGIFEQAAPGFPSSGSANGRIGINQPDPQRSFDISGSVRVSSLATGLTAPTTSGTTKMVITDSNGDLSFTDISGGNAFPYTGSAQITGSLTITGSLIVSQSLFQYADNTDADIGTETVISIATGSYRAAFFDYVAVSGSNARAGTVTAVWNGASIEYTEASTTDIGNTTNCNLQTVLSSGNVVLQSRMLSDNWSVKALARLL